ncbi:V-type ATP synthase subunit A [bacterium]|nr:V-type ATP synthase subunit A [bacterium]
MENTGKREGTVYRVNGPAVTAAQTAELSMGEQVLVGEMNLPGEIIRQEGDLSTIQMYEDTTDIRPGDVVKGLGSALSVELGPGLLGSFYDGIQRPLDRIYDKSGTFIARGISVPKLNEEKKWRFVPCVKVGDEVKGGDIIGTVIESRLIVHKIMVPPNEAGRIVKLVPEGDYTVKDEIGSLDSGAVLRLAQRWPVRRPRPVAGRLEPNIPLFTGQRVIDFFFTIARGGAAAIPGGFGTGKTVTQHQLAKWCDANVIVYIGCGERGNEMTQVLQEFPELKDPKSGYPLIERTVLIANTSNMPVTAREASIYTGITIAEYYRDMGYHVAIMADSTSRWAEALREISGRLEEMPAEEGFPAYLGSRLAEFYERAGRVVQGEGEKAREGSISVIGAVSPQGGDFSEPVTQNTRRYIRAFWALDKALASARHFPSINWNDSYSEYVAEVLSWWKKEVPELDYAAMREKAMQILQEENKLQQVVKLVGPDALPDKQRVLLETADIIKQAFLQQNAFHSNDVYCSPRKQLMMMDVILYFYEQALKVVDGGTPFTKIAASDLVTKIIRMKTDYGNEEAEKLANLKEEITKELKLLQEM